MTNSLVVERLLVGDYILLERALQWSALQAVQKGVQMESYISSFGEWMAYGTWCGQLPAHSKALIISS
jgi:hypothetical protein